MGASTHKEHHEHQSGKVRRQVERGSSLTTQRGKCKAPIKARGWKLVGEYVDDGISGAKDDRRGRRCSLYAEPQVKAVIVAFCATGCQTRPLGIWAAFCSA